jgi:hypothetical protein
VPLSPRFQRLIAPGLAAGGAILPWLLAAGGHGLPRRIAQGSVLGSLVVLLGLVAWSGTARLRREGAARWLRAVGSARLVAFSFAVHFAGLSFEVGHGYYRDEGIYRAAAERINPGCAAAAEHHLRASAVLPGGVEPVAPRFVPRAVDRDGARVHRTG